MSDGAQAITKAGSKVFSSCPDCQNSDRLMCWSHTIRAVQQKIKTIEKMDKKISKQILQRNDTLFAQPDGLKLRSAGYDWLAQHKSNTNFVRFRAKI